MARDDYKFALTTMRVGIILSLVSFAASFVHALVSRVLVVSAVLCFGFGILVWGYTDWQTRRRSK